MAPQTMVDLRRGYVEAMESLRTGTYKASGDVIDYTLYDREILDFTTPRLTFRAFQAGVGQNDPAGTAKTQADTNVQGAQGIPVGQKLYVNAVKLIYTATEERTPLELNLIQELFENSSFNLRIAGKDTYGLWKLSELLGSPMNCTIIPAATNYNIPTSFGKYHGIFPLNLPIVLASQVQFETLITHHVTAATYTDLDGDWLTICLAGILERVS